WTVWPLAGPNLGAPMAHLVRSEAPGMLIKHRFTPDTALAEGASLHVGETFAVRGGALVALDSGGNLRVARDSMFEVTAENSVRLERGEIYVDIPPGVHSGLRFVARTAAG